MSPSLRVLPRRLRFRRAPILFWLVSAFAVVGEQQRARDPMERLLRVASPLGLYAEEFDAATGRHLGNFRQAFSHLALIEAVARLVIPEMIAEY
jgi:alpha,alpha-trehalase